LAIRKLKENHLRVAIKLTLNKINFDDLTNYLDLTEKLNADFVSVARYIPYGGGKRIEVNALSMQETKKAYELVLKYARKNEGKIAYDTRRPLWALLSDNDTKIGGRCVAGINGLTIMPNGDILPCRPMGVKIGNVLKNTFFEIWYTSDFLWKLRNYKIGECKSCSHGNYCGGCFAISNAIKKNFFVKDPQCFKEMMA
jgi:radical SAM protein with 4Fe4S-binding SPASM domain